MSITGIVLIVAGVIVLALGYLVPVRKKDLDTESILVSEDEIRRMVDRELDNVKTHISDIVDETVTYSMEKTERSMERVANEKIMAVNEYSDTVLEEINKNHKEVIFLYDMLNDKHENLKSAVAEATQTTDEVRQTLKDAIITAQQADKAIEHVENLAKETGDAIIKAMDEMDGMVKNAAYERENAYQTQNAYRQERYEDDYAQNDGYADENVYTGAEDYAGYETYKADKAYEADAAYAEEDIYADDAYAEDSGHTAGGYVDAYTEESRYTQEDEYADDYANEEYAEDENYVEEESVYEEPFYRGAEPARGRVAEKMRFDDEEDYFRPITPPRVNIIHDADGDYVADPPQPEPAVAREEERRAERRPARDEEFGAIREEERRPARKQPAARKTAARPTADAPARQVQASAGTPSRAAANPSSRPASSGRGAAAQRPAARRADTKSVNIQFANGRDNGRNSNERILELHKAGKSNMAIAKELGLGIGEVKLVIDLFEGL
ncbi:MAG: DUF6115 domain-containing protein [Ruminococcus sp.]|nr:DUF6115 domain-containing protein [Ruminococcus sp.]